MKISIFFFPLLFSSLILDAQYEQKISVDMALGVFKTFGDKYNEDTGPMQMPNYKMGLAGNGGIQFMLNEHLSLSAGAGILISNRWNYKTQDVDNWMHWSIDDTITGQVLEEGENYLDMHNFSIYVKPGYYLLPGKKWNPYFFAGINLNITNAYYEDSYFYAARKWGRIPQNEPDPSNDNLEHNVGIGFNPGFGIEYSPGSMIHFFTSISYYFIKLSEDSFTSPSRVENFNAAVFQAGCRLYFIKSKELF